MGDFEDGAGHVAMYAKERDGGDEGSDVHVSSAAVMPQSSEFIEYLLWAMEQIDSPDAKVRQRWWVYRSKVEHPEDNESIEYGVSFLRVQSQPEPQEYSFLPQQEEAGWRDVTSPPFSTVPSTLAAFQWRR